MSNEAFILPAIATFFASFVEAVAEKDKETVGFISQVATENLRAYCENECGFTRAEFLNFVDDECSRIRHGAHTAKSYAKCRRACATIKLRRTLRLQMWMVYTTIELRKRPALDAPHWDFVLACTTQAEALKPHTNNVVYGR